MARCLLADILAAGLKAITHRLTIQDYINLRQVSHTVSACTSACIAHITLRLSDSSTTQQLRQWFKATQPLQKVPRIHIQIDGAVSAQIFELAMQLLSQRTSIKELHLLNVNTECDGSTSLIGPRTTSTTAVTAPQALLASLEPVKHLMPRLQVLVINGLEVKHLHLDLGKLAAAAAVESEGDGWQLQRLTLKAVWSSSNAVHWSRMCLALLHLAQTTPKLTHLDIQLPPLTYSPLVASITSSVPYDGASYGEVCDFEDWKTHQAKTAAVASLANAVLQLHFLQLLSVSGVPDLWRMPAAVQDRWTAEAMTPVTAAVDAKIIAGQLPSTAASSSVFPTLDDCGCWLLQQHPRLKYLHMGTEGSVCSMSWQQQQQCHDDQGSSTGDTSPAAEVVAIDMQLYTSLRHSLRLHLESSSSNEQYLFTCCKHQLSQYSTRALPDLLCHVSSCQFTVDSARLVGINSLLGDLKSLKHLQIQVPKIDSHDPISASDKWAAIITAAAALQSLQSLAISIGAYGPPFELANDLLLPLTAAAGGPGSSLTKLKFKGDFATAADGGSGWLNGLSQLDGLVEFSLFNNEYRDMCEIPVDSLPAGLKAFHGCNLDIKSAAAVDSDDGTTARPQLQKLSLHKCVLRSPSILASRQLQQLTVSESSWAGGWAEAAAAWPAITKLTWAFNSHDNSKVDGGSRQAVKGFEVKGVSQFKDLVHIVLNDVCGLKRQVFEDALQLLRRWHPLKIKYMKFDCSNNRLSGRVADCVIAEPQRSPRYYATWASVSVAHPPCVDMSELSDDDAV